MDNEIKSRLGKKDILTIPNMLSFFRILLIPLMAVLYCHYEAYYAAVVVIVVSGITDILDGKIARKFNMVSDFGKFLDPLADKLTQAAMALCLAVRYSGMGVLFILMLVKESVLSVCAYHALKATNTVNSAKWYGKVTTATLYVIMVLLFLSPDIPSQVAEVGILLCGTMIIMSMILYVKFFIKILTEKRA
ncbi:MAG: CDP-alcohol phosphatidyltransferase family protein [Lachnospiraceae bacterium]|nr:CDP-alcohol phosphatidyltransferase family protein [Lachnospiraceae bacterium]